MDKNRQREVVRQTVGVEAGVVQHALNNPNGVALLGLMRKQFDGRFHVDSAQHAFNAGQRDVVVWLEQKLDFTME